MIGFQLAAGAATQQALLNAAPSRAQRLHITTDVVRMADAIDRAVQKKTTARVPLVGISGIDASGKGHVAAQVAARLRARGHNVALIGLDDWHQPRQMRFGDSDAGAHFYRNAFRWHALFQSLIEPLRSQRSLELTTTLIEPATDRWYSHTYLFAAVDVILLAGVFLYSQERRSSFDLRWWVECSFENALQRARRRNQEKLPDAELVADYERIYFPAQYYHLERDQPLAFIDGVLLND